MNTFNNVQEIISKKATYTEKKLIVAIRVISNDTCSLKLWLSFLVLGFKDKMHLKNI